ncbi:MAG: 16S rRNA (adenine(1518)-N(6)/adenine(1519)-N(6))-dimethyltransferase RsmA [Acidobacteria bacterium]|jgi:16S rRNA (adenine1518-N6/adenine1519-N6)-dimethyltransferase|nr:16S rRNA (adenine(1518)-N(6)/adenine(1519)-N(6))-dimethyltransferase RsmA [Acidobacteriota bacterium]
MGRPKRRRLGQNFLVDRNVAERIASQLSDEPPRVLEIGPGRGALTEHLLERFERVVALELDEVLVPQLEQRFGGLGLQVRHADALRIDLDSLAAAESPWQVASNLPYSVGTAILRRILRRHDLFSRAVVMLQREVAHRIVADPGGKGHGLLALERAAWADARLLFDVQPVAFRPRPKVVSTVVALDLKRPVCETEILDRALGLASAALTLPRKKLRNALSSEVSAATVEAAGLDPAARPGTLSLQDWLRLAEHQPIEA